MTKGYRLHGPARRIVNSLLTEHIVKEWKDDHGRLFCAYRTAWSDERVAANSDPAGRVSGTMVAHIRKQEYGKIQKQRRKTSKRGVSASRLKAFESRVTFLESEVAEYKQRLDALMSHLYTPKTVNPTDIVDLISDV